jgi:UDP-N-acetyl-D-mannosaminuronate dehydrogenase
VDEHLNPHLHDGQVLILRSTVNPGTSARVQA